MLPAKKSSTPEQKKWKVAWRQSSFRTNVLIGIALNIPVLVFFPFFFRRIEQRNGVQLSDLLLTHITAVNVSIFIFVIIWSMAVLLIIRTIQQPEILPTFLFSFFVLSISRIVTISLVPLNPPTGLIPLADPLSNTFYGGSFVTKDLFYSGHVATQFLMYLCLKRKMDKWLALSSTIGIAILVLIQHVHYTVDILAAPLFAYGCYLVGKYLANQNKFARKPGV